MTKNVWEVRQWGARQRGFGHKKTPPGEVAGRGLGVGFGGLGDEAEVYLRLWDSIYGETKLNADNNPWVWVRDMMKVEKP